MSRVAVVGLGGMGSRMAARLLEAGHSVLVWNRSGERAGPLLSRGAEPAESPAHAARRADVLITMVTGPDALRAVTSGPHGIAAGAHADLTIVEMSTVGPAAVHELAADLPAGTGLVDAPVLGSYTAAEGGSLAIFAGGSTETIAAVQPVLEALGTVVPVGALGMGAAAKLVANAALISTLTALGESVALGDALGLQREVTLSVLDRTPLAAQAERRREVLRTHEHPPSFPLPLAHKDGRLIAEVAAGCGLDIRVLRAATSWLAEAEAAGLAALDYSAVLERILPRGADEPPRKSRTAAT